MDIQGHVIRELSDAEVAAVGGGSLEKLYAPLDNGDGAPVEAVVKINYPCPNHTTAGS